MSINQETESRYYCAGRYCTMRESCHRHTSSVHVNDADFYDYDLIKLRLHTTSACPYYVDRDRATGVNSTR